MPLINRLETLVKGVAYHLGYEIHRIPQERPGESASHVAPVEPLPPAHQADPDPDPAPARTTHRLKFTGSASAAEFQEAVQKVPFWYHAYYFDNGYEVHGDYNPGLNIADFDLPKDMTGMKVLDIGPAAGWFAFYFEQLGAEVTVVETRGYCDFDTYGLYRYEPVPADRAADRLDEQGRPIYFGPASAALWAMKDLLKSKIRFVNARVYEVTPELFNGEKFDLVFMGSLLCHLRDPIGALRAARSVCGGRLITSSPLWQDDTLPYPAMFLPHMEVGGDAISWWWPNSRCYKHWFLAAGFTDVDVSRVVDMASDVVRKHEQLGVDANVTHKLCVAHAKP